MNKSVLTQPFAPEQVKQRPGAHGKNVHYVDVASVVARLNEGCDAWDFFIDKYEVHEAEVLVQGRLVADGVTKCAFGGSSVTVDKGGKVVSVAEDLSGAASRALKKCASLLGVGLEMYGGQPAVSTPKLATVRAPVQRNATARAISAPVAASSREPIPTAPTAPIVAPAPSQPTTTAPRRSVPAEDPSERATVRQLAAIHSASRRHGYDRQRLATFLTESTGKSDLSHLTRGEASTVIDSLNQVARAH